MKLRLIICLCVGLLSVLGQSAYAVKRVDKSEDNLTYGNMYQWRSHFAYADQQEVVVMPDLVYVLSSNSLFSVDKQTDEIRYYSRLTGMTSAVIDHIAYNSALQKMLVAYRNGQLDVIDAAGDLYNIPDLYLKQMSAPKQVNDVCMHSNKAYLAMGFGVLVLNMAKHEVEGTYYIDNAISDVNVRYLTILGDTLYAASNQYLYAASLQDNLMDFAYWKRSNLPAGDELQGMRPLDSSLCIVRDTVLWSYTNGAWAKHTSEYCLRGLCSDNAQLFAMINNRHGVVEVHPDFKMTLDITYGAVNDVKRDGSGYWLATTENGVVQYKNGSYREFRPNGPLCNTPYRLNCHDGRVYVVPGGRWATQNYRAAELMYFDDEEWTNLSNGTLTGMAGMALYDLMNVAQDPLDRDHYFVTSFGTGMLEMQGTELVKLHLPDNSALESAVAGKPQLYTRTDGAMYDEQGYLWVLNTGVDASIKILSPDGKWSSLTLYYQKVAFPLHTPGEMVVDKRNAQWKWIPICRYNTGLVLLKDNGTPTRGADDKVYYRNEWFDQNNNQIKPEYIYTIAQDNDNTLWVGTSKGIFSIPARVDFATSDRCERIIIPRNDGTNLGDYLLDGEKINCIVVDGANRKWIGTESSGLYLIQLVTDDMGNRQVDIVEHFTAENSLMPSDNVLSLAIDEATGEVFVGTSEGLVSYLSDAIAPSEDFTTMYAYPNPVYPTYKGYVTIRGLMDDTEVRVLDAGGNLVKLLSGQGGEVVWDVTNTQGSRVASGVYTILANTRDGNNHQAISILIMN